MNPLNNYLPPKPATPPLAQSTISVENPKLLNMKTNKEEEEEQQQQQIQIQRNYKPQRPPKTITTTIIKQQYNLPLVFKY